MAFSLDFSSIPSIPGVPTPPEAISGLSDMSKNLIDKITSNPRELFSNPMISAVNSVGDATTFVEERLQAIADGSVFNSGITSAEATEFFSGGGVADLRTAMGNFLMHTYRLSGVLTGFGIEAPGLQQILSIGTQMQNMMSIVDGASDCLAVLGGATGLFSGEQFAAYGSQLANILNQIDNGLVTITEIAQQILEITTLINGIVDKDSRFLAQCVNQLQTAAIGMAIEALDSNPCFHFVLDQIKNTNPGGIMDILAEPILKLT